MPGPEKHPDADVMAAAAGTTAAPANHRWASSGAALWVVAALMVVRVADFQINGAAEFGQAGYCSAPGNTNADGSVIPPGTFLNLIVGMPDRDARLAGAVPANYIEGVGLSCSGPPSGYVRRGLATDAQNVRAGIYPYYAPAG